LFRKKLIFTMGDYFEKRENQVQSVVSMPVIPALRRLRQKDGRSGIHKRLSQNEKKANPRPASKICL
jgi:hypothetical protein